jgi:predicted CxxxxCH...CXXCH cytochrome family protein
MPVTAAISRPAFGRVAMRTSTSVAVLLLCLVGFGAAGCSKAKENPQGTATHPDGWLDPGDERFHGSVALASYADGNVSYCQGCHGLDYDGGCVACHAARGAEECTTCHGGHDNASGAPPRSLDSSTVPGHRGVGAHTTMVTGFALADGFDCGECHPKPDFVFRPGHFAPADLGGSGRAEVVFSSFADRGAASYDSATGSCAQVYCHGAFAGGLAASVGFRNRYDTTATDTSGYLAASGARCGSCHAADTSLTGWDAAHREHVENLPAFDCLTCHDGVASPNPSAEILNRSLHVNGLKDVILGAAAGSGATWDPGTKSCSDLLTGCHGGETRQWGSL